MSPTRPPRSSLARRAFLALALTIGFYVLAIVMMGLLVLLVGADLASGHLHFQLLVIAVVAFFAILIAIIPRGDKFEPPWPQLIESQSPLLFKKLESIANAAGQRMPAEVYLLPDLNAWVSDRGRGGRRRVMGIGLPLLQLLDEQQFSAVIAHEFGHYYGGDTQLGPWTYRTHATIGRTLQSLNQNSIQLVQAPFNAYARVFLRVSRSVSREQEYTADRFAAGIAGPAALASALKRLAGYSEVVDIFWQRFLFPTLGSGYRPGVIEGLAQLFQSERTSALATNTVSKLIASPTDDPYDTHPSLRDRLAALDQPADASSTTATAYEPAIRLAGDPRVLEDRLLGMYIQFDDMKKLEPIDWNDVGERVFLSFWRALREKNRDVLSAWTVDELGAVLYAGNAMAADVVDVSGANPERPEQKMELLYLVCVACIGLALQEAGWTFVARPEHGICFVRGEEALLTTQLVGSVAGGVTSQEAWNDTCQRTGIRGMRMSGGMSPTGPGNRWSAVLHVSRGSVVNPSGFAPGIRYEGGNGADIFTAIILRGAHSAREVEKAKFLKLREWYGELGRDWDVVGEARREHRGRQIDEITVRMRNGRTRSLYFDVTECGPQALEEAPPTDGDSAR